MVSYLDPRLMDRLKKIKFYLFPILFLILPACIGLFFEFYNHFYRGVSTPFLFPSIGLILISVFFWVKKRWLYFALVGVTAAYLIFFFQFAIWKKSSPPSLIFNYESWELNTATGQIKLKIPIGTFPPSSGSYISCHFSLKSWTDYLNMQPILCTAFDDQLRLKMFLNDHETDEGLLREVHVNQFRVDRKSLMGEPLDRSALRIAFSPLDKGIRKKFKVKAIYQVYEREISPGKTHIVESFSRDSKGNLKSFTESPLLKFANKDVYAVYDHRGILVEIPRMKSRTFSFPAKIDINLYKNFQLPPILTSDTKGFYSESINS